MADNPPTKSALRREFLQKRLRLTPPQKDGAARALADVFLQNVILPAASVVAGYWPIRGEMDDRPLLHALLGRGHACVLPRVEESSPILSFLRWDGSAALVEDKYGIAAPAAGEELWPEVVLAPLLAFDARGHRLGYGKGYYDRTLAALRREKPVLAVGLGYEWQGTGALPVGAGDVSMDVIVTEKNVYRFGKAG